MSYTSHQPASDYTTTITLPPLPVAMEMWFKPTIATPDISPVVLMAMYDPSAVKYLRIQWVTNNTLQGVVYDGTLNSVTGASTNTSSWNNVVVNFNGTGVSGTGLDIYVNNVKSSSTFSYTWSTSTAKRMYLFGLAENNALGSGNSTAFCAYAGVYVTSLSNTDVTSLQTLYPSQVQTGYLPHRWDLTDLPPTDNVASTATWSLVVSGSDATLNNSDIPSLSSSGGGIVRRVRAFRFMQMGD